ncbi:MAG: HDOD domain-containing protein, partial [Verrucomicrobia bacterium]
MSYLSPSYPPPKISEIIESLPESVGSFSPALRHVEEVISRSYCTVDMVAEAVQTDVDLAARLMRYANSSDIAFAHQITSLAQAVSVIGTHQVTEL